MDMSEAASARRSCHDDDASEDAESLHGEDGGDEPAAGLLVGVLGHDGGAERVVAADAEPSQKQKKQSMAMTPAAVLLNENMEAREQTTMSSSVMP
jgi:hypothetical protein